MTGKTAPKLALVTGGCKRLGAVIAAQLARAGYRLALHGHDAAEPDDNLQAVLDECGIEWHGFTADLESPQAPEDLMRAVIARFGCTPDLLINNASRFQYDDWQTLTGDSLSRHFQVNMHAPVMLAQLLVASSDANDQPAIINVIDQRVRNPNGDQLAYTLSKQALAESIRTLACAFGHKARVNGVAPGMTIATDEFTSGQMERLATEMPLQRLSQPEDIAEAVLYLAHAKSVTGQLIFVDGGAHMVSYDRDFVFMQR